MEGIGEKNGGRAGDGSAFCYLKTLCTFSGLDAEEGCRKLKLHRELELGDGKWKLEVELMRERETCQRFDGADLAVEARWMREQGDVAGSKERLLEWGGQEWLCVQRSSWEWNKKSGSGEGAEDKQPSTPGKAADVRRTEQGETTPEGRGGRAGKVEWREQAEDRKGVRGISFEQSVI